MGSTHRHALIVGSSDGIGLATARQLLSERWRVSGISRSPSPLKHGSYEHSVCDVNSPQYEQELRRVAERAGGLDCVVYCVGIGNDCPPERGTGESAVIDVNLGAAIRTLEFVLPVWTERGSGHFIGLSSLADALHLPDGASYCASKIALSRYLESVGLQVRRYGVAISNVRFGFVDTKMARSDVKPFLIPVDEAARVLREVISERPLRRSYPRRAAAAALLAEVWSRLRVLTTRPLSGGR